MNEPDTSLIALICDRCRAEGVAGGSGFAELGELLSFTPAPRQFKRQDGWTPALQRRFIAHLAQTGSPTRAAEALGKNRHGVEKLYKAKGAEGFRAAWDRAVAFAEDSAALRIEEEHAAARELKAPAIDMRRRPGEAEGGGDGDGGGEGAGGDEWDEPGSADEALKIELIERIAGKFLAKVRAERAARLAGEVVAADFYLRQITAMEVSLDLMAQSCGYSGFELLAECRRGGHNLFDIAETPFTRMLDAERRRIWAGANEPERPEHPPQRYLEHHVDRASGQGYSLEPSEAFGPASTPPAGVDAEEWAGMGYEEQREARAEQYRRDAEAQVAWEAKARREYDDRHGSAASA